MIREYEIEVRGVIYEMSVDVEVHHGDVVRLLATSLSRIHADLYPAVMAEIERLVDLDREEIERGCEEEAYERSVDDRIGEWKERG
jgi:hypothetical protein